MGGDVTTVMGIQIPSVSPVFLIIVGVHIVLGLLCVGSGAVAMLSVKAAGRHPTAGTTYYWSLVGVFASATALSVTRWAENYQLFILGTLAFTAAHFGRTARRRRGPGWARWHVAGMGSSYVLLLTAFYVDNGRNLPLWRSLPQAAFWVLPAAIGLPIWAWALLRHPLLRRGNRDRDTLA